MLYYHNLEEICVMSSQALATQRGPDFPDSDGDAMPEILSHQMQVTSFRLNCIERLKDEEEVYIGGNNFLYYNRHDQRDNVAPDVYIVLEVERRAREKYQTWDEEDKFPDLILEVLSPKTRSVDRHDKKELYARLGAREYLVYDARPNIRNRFFAGWHLVEGAYEEMPRLVSGGVFSEVLGAEVRVMGQWLRIIDPATGQPMPLPEEEPGLRHVAEAAQQRAEAAERRAAAAQRRAERRAVQEAAARQVAEQQAAHESAARQVAEERIAQEALARQQAERQVVQMAEELAQLRAQIASNHAP